MSVIIPERSRWEKFGVCIAIDDLSSSSPCNEKIIGHETESGGHMALCQLAPGYLTSPLPKSTPTPRRFNISAMATNSPPRKVLVAIANGSEAMEAVITIDILRRSGADVTVASVENDLTINAAWGITLVADALISDSSNSTFDLISLNHHLQGNPVVENLVKKQASDGLAAASRGPGTTMEHSLALVERLYGKDKAEEVAGAMVMRPNHSGDYTITELNSVMWTFSHSPQILVPIANGTEEMEAVMIIDILRRANTTVVVASVEDKLEIVASRKVKLVADTSLDEAVQLPYDLIVLPGGLPGAQAFANSEKLVNLLKKQMESNRPYGAICASPALVLEPHGLLKGKKATAFPAMCNKLSDQSAAENRVVIDANLITSRGPGTSMEFSLAIVEKFFGREKALELAKAMVFVSPQS